MKLPRSVIVLTAATFILAACADYQNNPKQTIGGLLGAGLGALAGSQVGSGKGQLVAVAIGALAGAALGSNIGRSLDDVDRLKAQQTTQKALESSRTGATSSWSNPDSGASGTVTPTRTYQTASGENCREYSQTVTIDGKQETAIGTACRQPDGNWRVIN